MRFLALPILVLAISSAHAHPEQDEQLRPILIRAITNQAKVLQLLIKCEAPAELTQKMSDTTMADLNEYKKTDPKGASAFEMAFQDGKAQADKLYQQLGTEANSSPACQQATQLARTGTTF